MGKIMQEAINRLQEALKVAQKHHDEAKKSYEGFVEQIKEMNKKMDNYAELLFKHWGIDPTDPLHEKIAKDIPAAKLLWESWKYEDTMLSIKGKDMAINKNRIELHSAAMADYNMAIDLIRKNLK